MVYNTGMKNTIYKSNKNVTYSCKYHVIWCSKYRRKVIVDSVEKRLRELIKDLASQLNIEIIEMETFPDHVRLLLEVDPQFGIHKAIKRIKGNSSKVLRSEFTQLRTKLPTLWTNKYFVSTIGELPLSAIQEYIESQQTSQRG